MTAAQRLDFSDGSRQAKGLVAIAIAILALFVAVATVAYLGVAPAPPGRTNPIAKAQDPACAAALARARASHGLSGDEAVAASTAMLRTCNVG
jgi:hypothetical protein